MQRFGQPDTKSLVKAAKTKAARNTIRLLAIQDDESYLNTLAVMQELILIAPDTPDNPYHELMRLLTNAIEAYEDRAYPIPKASPAAVLKFLMETHKRRQEELAQEIGEVFDNFSDTVPDSHSSLYSSYYRPPVF